LRISHNKALLIIPTFHPAAAAAAAAAPFTYQDYKHTILSIATIANNHLPYEEPDIWNA